ncbi:hypothetical protein ES319_A09G079500v1 [Gossypium barbadense]|uniref:GDP-fucose protein O-fucosyltransferase 2 n=1 Tax=Gossypium barbadense TaxID=3634 RepID=A0A5J5UEX4_GOSBA|nr:hypothetical protein ES319_A09G079500v1 [Gossypium barbadense]
MARDSPYEDDDHENLIHQNKDKSASFRIEELQSPIRRRFSKGHYLFAAVVTVISLVATIYLFFSSKICDTTSDRIKESQLRALYLLNKQRSSLFDLWNHTFGTSNNITAVRFDQIKASLLDQITLNRHIKDTLLSTENGTVSVPIVNGSEICRKIDPKSSKRRTIEWKPDPNKFLFAICLSGQMSNHLICLEKHMFFAAVLNRVLVIPGSKFDYQYNLVLDIDHINECIGRKTVISFENFMELKKNHARIDKFICYFSIPLPCYTDEDHLKKLKSLGISMGKVETAWKSEDIENPSPKTVKDVEGKFGTKEDVIAIGDVFFANVEKDWVLQPRGPIAHKCKILIEPSKLILLTAQRFIQTFLGSGFVALHFRRHGFLKFCNAKKPSCFYPIPQAADCIRQMVEKANTSVIYLSTDAAESETSLLQSMLVMNGKTIPLVKRPPRDSAEKWDSLLYRHGLDGDDQVEAMLDKTICAMASVFIGAPGSTFTEDILRLRKGWETASSCDEYLCHGEEPNFIAGDE